MLIPIILSGGSGSRLWPVSRASHPKPFMKLLDGQSLLQKTYLRASKIPNILYEGGLPKVLTVTNRDYYFMSRDELSQTGLESSFLLEPFSRNTAPAIALAAHNINCTYGPDALMIILPADHLISDERSFNQDIERALFLAKTPNHFLVTFGVVPTGPETGFGYIEAGSELKFGNRVNKFTEKPDLKTAQAYLSAGNYFWNSGIFCFSAGSFLKELGLHSPNIARAAKVCWEEVESKHTKKSTVLEIPEQLFGEMPNISIDYALMEKSNQVAVIPSNFGWNDIGSWNAIQNLVEPDQNNNRALSEAIFVDSDNTYIQSEDRLVATVGISNMMIIDTKDALLVTNRACTQDVKKVVDLLKQKKHETYSLHRTVARPWGTYTVLEDHPGFKIKRIEVKPGGKLSLQMHHHRSEHWIVVKGCALVTNGDETILLHPNESTFIPAGHKHRLENPKEMDLVLIEVQCGSYLGEDDIVRFEDTYGRV